MITWDVEQKRKGQEQQLLAGRDRLGAGVQARRYSFQRIQMIVKQRGWKEWTQLEPILTMWRDVGHDSHGFSAMRVVDSSSPTHQIQNMILDLVQQFYPFDQTD